MQTALLKALLFSQSLGTLVCCWDKALFIKSFKLKDAEAYCKQLQSNHQDYRIVTKQEAQARQVLNIPLAFICVTDNTLTNNIHHPNTPVLI